MSTLITIHSLLRWVIFILLSYSVYRAYTGYTRQQVFGPGDNKLRHFTATAAHIQLLVGMTLYFTSPTVKYFWANRAEASQFLDVIFFSVIHIALMFTAIIILTVGSALTKRTAGDRAKFKKMLVWYSVALLLILVAIPWPFSPLASRPYLPF